MVGPENGKTKLSGNIRRVAGLGVGMRVETGNLTGLLLKAGWGDRIWEVGRARLEDCLHREQIGVLLRIKPIKSKREPKVKD